jgi:hypothetical protein
MLLTEEEAMEKWCPFAMAPGSHEDRTTAPTVTVSNRVEFGHPYKLCRCLASECMAWRWYPSWDYGYCGLVGNPEGPEG